MNTFYWYRSPEVIEESVWEKFKNKVKNIFDMSNISIANIYGEYESKPAITNEYIAFNGEYGDAADYFCICKDGMMESSIDNDGSVIGYCASKGNLYEKVVQDILKIALTLEIIEEWWRN